MPWALLAGLGLFVLGVRRMQTDTDRLTLARTLWGEARGEGRAGMEAVAAVIVNRAQSPRWPDSIAAVCKQPWQFSAWNDGNPNRAKMLRLGPDSDDPAFQLAWEIAGDAVAGRLPDRTNGADHYHADYVSPSWASGMTRTAAIGSHQFYRSA
jgi:spore germination cell wall hydrolase CwlJ-like protein